MKILRLAPYVTIPDNRQFARNLTGFGRSVWDISRHMADKGDEVHLFTYACTNGLELDGVTFISHRITDCITSARLADLPKAIRIAVSGPKQKSVGQLKRARRVLLQGRIEWIIEKEHPDIVHVHGLDEPFLVASQRANRPFVVTLHGLNSLSPGISYEAQQAEKRLVENINEAGIHISVISSSVRDTMLDRWSISFPDNIHVIPHGVDSSKFRSAALKEELRREYGIPQETMVILNVASLIPLKNQMAILAALEHLLPNDHILCILVGQGPDQARLMQYVNEHELDRFVQLVGHVEGQTLVDYYRLADVFVFASVAEGFGRPMLEAMAAGLPVVTYEDLGAVKDIYNPSCMSLVKDRNPEELANALRGALCREWEPRDIEKWASRFTWDEVVNQYVKLYELAKSDFQHSACVGLGERS